MAVARLLELGKDEIGCVSTGNVGTAVSSLAAKAGDNERFRGAPFHAPMRRLDETLAARKPRLRWRPVAAAPLAAE